MVKASRQYTRENKKFWEVEFFISILKDCTFGVETTFGGSEFNSKRELHDKRKNVSLYYI